MTPPGVLRRLVRAVRSRTVPLRTHAAATRVLGPAFARSRSRIELDITWACNLRCANCNRSCAQAPTGEGMTLDQVQRFVAESIARGKRWERIRVIGGEPTLHPDLDAILSELLRYRAHTGGTVVIELATHGHGERVRSVLARLPPEVQVDDSHKDGPDPLFEAFNAAPVDDPAFARADFRNGCPVTEVCGVGLGPYGYYACAVAAGIDRVVGGDIGRKALPVDADDLHDQLAASCRMCGHFARRGATVTTPTASAAWRAAYARWRAARPALTRY